MGETRVLGLVPHVPANQPRATPRWWCAVGVLDDDGTLTVESLDERDTPLRVDAPCGIAAPLSLPPTVLEYLGAAPAELARWTPQRLFARVRRFAREQQRGKKHPRRAPHESHSALDRRRLARYHAALPLAGNEQLIEVDVPAWLSSLALPPHGLSGADPKSIARRVTIANALEEGLAGIRLRIAESVYVHASLPALEAVMCAFATAWVVRNDPPRPAEGDVWIPIP